MKKRVKKLIALLMTAIAISWVVPQGTIDVLAADITIGINTPDTFELSADSSDYYTFGSGASRTLIVNAGVTLSGSIQMRANDSVYAQQVINKGTIHTINAVNSGAASIINEGTISSHLVISAGKLSNSGNLNYVTLADGGGSKPVFEMDGGTADTLIVQVGKVKITDGNVTTEMLVHAGTTTITGGTITLMEVDGNNYIGYPVVYLEGGNVTTLKVTNVNQNPKIQLGGGTVGTLDAEGEVEITGTPVVTNAKASKFTGEGTVTVDDSVELGAGSTATVSVSPDTKVTVTGENGVDVTVVKNNKTKVVTIPAGMPEQTPFDLFSKTVTFTTGTGHMSTTDALPAGPYWFGDSTEVVTYKADNGYYFPENYGETGVSCNGTGIQNITRVDASTIQVSYTLGADETDDVTLTLPAATPKANQEAPTGLVGGVNEITGTTTSMEYAIKSDAADSEWKSCTAETTAIPTAGNWFLRYKGTDEKFSGQPVAVQVLTSGTGSITVEDICYGKQPLPIVNSATNGTENVRIEYKKKSETDDNYTTVVPTTVGDYTARAIFAGQGLYDRVVATDDFSITFMRLAKDPYTISAEKGNNGFYKSIVTVVAEQGYLLAEKLDGDYVSSLTYDASKGAFSLFAVKKDTGEKSNAIGLAGFKVDRVVPSIDAVDGQTYYTDTVEFAIADDNLESVSVNGKKVTLDTTGEIAFSSNDGVVNYEVVITDQAGNIRRVSFTVASKWLKTRVVPIGQAVLLTTENAYKLGSGTWKVNGDSTSYNGNQSFYVGSEGEYVFTGDK